MIRAGGQYLKTALCAFLHIIVMDNEFGMKEHGHYGCVFAFSGIAAAFCLLSGENNV